MFNKQIICQAFCSEIEVHKVPAGYAIKTPFEMGGDFLGLFIIESKDGSYCLEDSGLIIPFIEASGINLDKGQRYTAFKSLLEEHSAIYDDDEMVVKLPNIKQENINHAIVQFTSLLLRLQDLTLLHYDVVENTFKEDAINTITNFFTGKADIQLNASPIPDTNDFLADVILKNNENTAALYIATRDAKVDEAVMLWMQGQISSTPYHVAVLYETEKPNISNISYRRAQNRLDATMFYRHEEMSAMHKLSRILKIPQSNASSLH